MRPIGFMLAALAFLTFPARANDSSAELATGGLVFTRSDAIEMASEDLFISAKEIRVRYRFRNTSAQPVTTLVAFPMPDITIEQDTNVAIPVEDPANLLGFKTIVDGRPVEMQVEQKAIAQGIDQTALLKRLGIPLAPHVQATNQALDRLPQSQWDELVQLGLAEITEYSVGPEGMKKHLEARWTLKTTFFWRQTFPAGRELSIDHAYQPSVGASVQTSVGNPDLMQEDWVADYQRKYCMDRAFLGAAQRVQSANRRKEGWLLQEERIAYILKTGANWAGPIREFRLVVDKGAPDNLVSFCGEGVKKIAPTQFEMRKRDFTPTSDFYVLILKNVNTN
jgi:hypothetical protein